MTCIEFVEGFSEYYDGTASVAYVEAADAHLDECASCRRYRHVVECGSELARALPAPEINEDFGPRLQHRLYHVDDDATLRPPPTSSGSTAFAVAGMAVLLTAVAWSPALRETAPTVELAPIVVSRPPSPMRLRASRLYPVHFSVSPATDESGLWDDASALLFHYSPLYQRYDRWSTLHNAGLEQDH